MSEDALGGLGTDDGGKVVRTRVSIAAVELVKVTEVLTSLLDKTQDRVGLVQSND